MKVIQVVPSIAEEASGPSYSVPRLAAALGQLGANVELHVLAPAPEPVGAYRVRAHAGWPLFPRLGVSPAMRRALRRASALVDVIHNHSLWMMPNVYPAWAARGRACRLVTSPRGALAEWALRHSAWRKRLMWLLGGQGRALRASHCFHATAEIEYQDVRRAGLRGPVAIIPNGIDIGPEAGHREDRGGLRRLLFLSRIHPKKGIDVLLRSWRQVQERFPEWELRVVGPDEQGHRGTMKKLADALGVARVTFAGPAYGAGKVEEFEGADLFVLPTRSENFGLAVAEALAHSVPCVVTRGAPWQGLESTGSGWWIDHGVEPLAECLETALSLPPQRLQEMGLRGRQWMVRDFSWDRVGLMMLETYRWLLGGGAPPAWVAVD